MNRKVQGQGAESWLAQELSRAGWQVVAQGWHCPWGELDLVLLGGGVLVFVEVKARQQWGLDEGGALAVGIAKQRKLIRAAGLFLSEQVHLEYTLCRFDVALIKLLPQGYELRSYWEGAFEVSEVS